MIQSGAMSKWEQRTCSNVPIYIYSMTVSGEECIEMIESLLYVFIFVKPHSIVLYCIVLYLYIYIALLEVDTSQKRFQCERPQRREQS